MFFAFRRCSSRSACMVFISSLSRSRDIVSSRSLPPKQPHHMINQNLSLPIKSSAISSYRMSPRDMMLRHQSEQIAFACLEQHHTSSNGANFGPKLVLSQRLASSPCEIHTSTSAVPPALCASAFPSAHNRKHSSVSNSQASDQWMLLVKMLCYKLHLCPLELLLQLSHAHLRVKPVTQYAEP